MNEVTEQMSKDIATLYRSGKSSTLIGRHLDISVPTVFRHLKKHGVISRSQSEAKRKYFFDEGYFTKIDSHEKAQILGMIAADGNINSKRDVFEITLERDDTDYLQHIKICLQYDGPLQHLYNKRFNTHHSRLSITSSLLKAQLGAVGIFPRKSLNLSFPTVDQVPKEFLSSYMLGYFEGDGTIRVRHGRAGLTAVIKICVTKEFGESLQALMTKLNIGSSLFKNKLSRSNNVNTLYLQIAGTRQVKTLCQWMYSKAPFVMKRKQEKWLHLNSQFDKDGNRIKIENWKEVARQKAASTFARNGTQPGRAPKCQAYFLSPTGQVYHTIRIGLFAREMGLVKSVMYYMAKGKKHVKTFHGWSIATPSQVESARSSGILIERFY